MYDANDPILMQVETSVDFYRRLRQAGVANPKELQQLRVLEAMKRLLDRWDETTGELEENTDAQV